MYITSRNSKDCETTASELNALGPGSCISIPADLQQVKEVERLVSELASRETALHVLVNNAGTAWAATIDDFPVNLPRQCSGVFVNRKSGLGLHQVVDP